VQIAAQVETGWVIAAFRAVVDHRAALLVAEAALAAAVPGAPVPAALRVWVVAAAEEAAGAADAGEALHEIEKL